MSYYPMIKQVVDFDPRLKLTSYPFFASFENKRRLLINLDSVISYLIKLHPSYLGVKASYIKQPKEAVIFKEVSPQLIEAIDQALLIDKSLKKASFTNARGRRYAFASMEAKNILQRIILEYMAQNKPYINHSDLSPLLEALDALDEPINYLK